MTQEERPVLLLVSAGGRDEAERLAEGLVEARLAGSASVIPVIHSFFYSEDRLQRDHEALVLVKTSTLHSAAAQEWIGTHHSSGMPDVLEVSISGGSAPYLSWLLQELHKDSP